MAQKLIIIDSAHPLVRQNRCFDQTHEYTGCGHAINVRLAREARRRGMDVATADVYLGTKGRPSQAACLTDMVSPFTEKLLAHGVKPVICMSLESPLVAKRFYHNMASYAGRFHHNFQFKGTYERLKGTGTIFHSVVFPMESRVALVPQLWDKRGHLILVNSNKRAVFQKRGNFKEIVTAALNQVQFWALKAIDPWMRIREIYVDRIAAIQYFSSHGDFQLFGMGWDQAIPGFGREYVQAARKVWSGPLEYQRKREVMGGFKYALCFENCAFPGYVTEKIFDCFLAGCIPVYFGAPDIADFVPTQAFIDYRKFEKYTDLDRYLRAMTEANALSYLDAAREFLAGEAFTKFTVDYFVNDVLNVMEQEFEKH